MKLIGLHGLPRSGKDSIANILHTSHGFRRISFADPLKEAAALLLGRELGQAHGIGYDREQVMPEWGFSMRWFLQRFGTECLRDQIREDFWIKRAEIELDKTSALGVVFSDVRFPNEVEFIRRRGGTLVEVRRSGVAGSTHVSDQHIDCDLSVDNNGTLDDLRFVVANLLPLIS